MTLRDLRICVYFVAAVTGASAQTADLANRFATELPRAVGISMSPSSANLYSSQTQQLNATVSGSSNTSVTWSITPAGAGSVSANGLYTTPTAIPTQQTITVTAASVADSTKSASASITLIPLTVSMSLSSANLYGGQTQQFSASIQKSTNTNVTWSISPAGTGSVTAAGLYTAPGGVPSATTVSVIAASAADPAKTASTQVNLRPCP